MSKPELIIMGIGVLAFLAGLFLAWLQRRCHHKYFLVRTGQGGIRILSCSKCGKIKYE